MPRKGGPILMIGHTLGHYRILEKLGEGGMGVVYRAHDERLERDVALKVLPADLLGDEAAQRRFRKEALALSKLNHPNIAAVYDFDVVDGNPFLAMELVEGQTLSKKAAESLLSEKEVAALGTQIAEALEEAHEHGIVHRDLKPGNIVVTAKGRAKVLDFGLAKLLHRAEPGDPTLSLTETRAVAGTLPYMAPEQLRGEALDARSDLYALGAVLYEMATGRRAFRDELSSRLADAILHQPPVAPRALNSRISPELERIILKCLEKDPENRYQSAKEIAVDLRRLRAPSTSAMEQAAAPVKHHWKRAGLAAAIGLVLLAGALVALNVGGLRSRWSATGKPRRIESLAVLPLENFSHDPEQDYFADGMTEALTTNLAQISALRVISRTSVMQYKGTRKPLPQIAKELNVDAVVEGSVQRSGNQVRITAQLVEAPTDRHLWAESYQRDLRNILALQDEVAGAIAREIQVKLTPQEQNRLAEARSVNPEAYEAYLKGRYYFNKGAGEKDIWTSIEYFEQAIRKDPNYAAAYAGIADAYVSFSDTYLSPSETMPKARAAAMKALELDEMLSEAHAALAAVRLFYDWDWPGAETEIQRAVQLNPSSAAAYDIYGTYFATLGQFDEAIAQGRRATQLDPLSAFINADLGWSFLLAHRYDEAIEQYQKTLAIEPNFAAAHASLGQAYAGKGEFSKAIAEVQEASQLDDSPFITLIRAGVYGVSGKRNEAEKVLMELKETSKRRYVCPYEVGTVYVGLGKNDEAVQWFQKAHQDRSICMVWLKGDPPWNSSLRSDPRFQVMLRHLGLPQ